MLLHELYGVKRYHNFDEHDFFKMLRRLGVKISNGKFGKVFSKPEWNFVYKIFDNDPYYLNFINYAMKHPNKHYPKVMKRPIEVHKFHKRFKEGGSDKWWVVKIEKLYEITDRNLLKFIVHNLENGMQAYYMKHVKKDADFMKYSNPYSPTLMPDGTYKRGISAIKLFEMFPWFETLSGAAMEYNESEDGGVNDIHGGNFMQRKDGTIVMIDPQWAGYNPYAAEREYMAGYEYMDDDETSPTISGPSYLKKNRPPRVEPRTQSHQKLDFDDMDDIPF